MTKIKEKQDFDAEDIEHIDDQILEDNLKEIQKVLIAKLERDAIEIERFSCIFKQIANIKETLEIY